MAGQRMIVKRLDAVQNLGAMSMLCTDKTGRQWQGGEEGSSMHPPVGKME
jgi:hypothetical protein